ncbi:hypothetical protein F2P81_019247 [Scophthalmus maximus]|uniref:Uncharacterized protein n=1 Tax=Scophthalmus maximus TaxID=52904 RepID=A0A6A4S975_SCOMX|nr:hypothetical protein F2P81_019247 [Scophthalmus maximus]
MNVVRKLVIDLGPLRKTLSVGLLNRSETPEDLSLKAHEKNSFHSVSRGDFEMKTSAVALKLSQKAGSIGSTDTSEIGFGLPRCIHRDPGRPLFCADQPEEMAE